MIEGGANRWHRMVFASLFLFFSGFFGWVFIMLCYASSPSLTVFLLPGEVSCGTGNWTKVDQIAEEMVGYRENLQSVILRSQDTMH